MKTAYILFSETHQGNGNLYQFSTKPQAIEAGTDFTNPYFPEYHRCHIVEALVPRKNILIQPIPEKSPSHYVLHTFPQGESKSELMMQHDAISLAADKNFENELLSQRECTPRTEYWDVKRVYSTDNGQSGLSLSQALGEQLQGAERGVNVRIF